MNAQHVKQNEHLSFFVCLNWLFVWRQYFVLLSEESFFLSDDLWLLIYTFTFFLDRKQKLRLHVTYMHCIFQAGWISVCFDQINEDSKYCCLFFSFNLYINEISLLNSNYMYDIENKFKFTSS